MLGGKACEVFIELDPISQPFYRAGDTVSGCVKLVVHTSSALVKDVQVKLRCDEYSAVAADDDRKQAMLEKREAKHARHVARRELKGRAGGSKDTFTAPRPKAAAEHQRHIELTANVFVADEVDGRRQPLPRGTHTFAFGIVLPEAVNMLPPHSPVPTRNGLRIGVEWTVKAIARRAGHLRSRVRAVAEIPVHPTPTTAGTVDISRRAELSGQRLLGKSKKWSYFGSFLGVMTVNISAGADQREQTLIVRLGYPEVGIPQGPVKPDFSLMLEAPYGPVSVTAIRVFLVQRCLACVHKKRQLNDAYKNMYALGEVRALREVGSQPSDLSDLVAGFELRDVFAAPFASNSLTISYELRITIECASQKENKPNVVSLEVPVNLLGPAVCWPSRSSGSYDARARAPVPRDRSDSDSSSLAELTADELGDNCLPSYEETVPSDTRVIDDDTFENLKR